MSNILGLQNPVSKRNTAVALTLKIFHIMSVALSNWKINERDMKLRTVQKVKMAITAGRIVADRETGEQYIMLTPFRDNLWLAQSHFGEIKPIDVKDYELTIHRVPERYVSYILEKMKFSTAG